MKEPEKAGGLSTRLGSVKLPPGSEPGALRAKSDLFAFRANGQKCAHAEMRAGEAGRR